MVQRNGGYGQFITCVFCSCFLLRSLSPAPVWASSHRTESPTNFSNVSPSHRQFFMNCHSMVCFLSSSVQSFRSRLLWSGLLLESQLSFGHPPALGWGWISVDCPPGAAGIPMTFMGCRAQLLHHRLQHTLQGKHPPAPGALPSTSSSLT